MPVLVVRYEDGIQTFPIEEGAPLFIGRADDCDVRLPSSAVSRKHAVIMYKNGICGVKDLGSFNGTSINGQIIQAPHKITDKDLLKISTFTMKIYLQAPEPGPAAAENNGGSPDSLGKHQTGPNDIAYFQENSLAHLNMIPDNADTSSESPLAQVRVIESADANKSYYSSEAETIIPLIEEYPLTTSLPADPNREDDEQDYRRLSSDTTYTLPPDLLEPNDAFNPDDYQPAPDTADYRRVLDTSRFTASRDSGEYGETSGGVQSSHPEKTGKTDANGFLKSDTGEFNAALDEFGSTLDEFGGGGTKTAPKPGAGTQAIIADVGKIGSSKTSIRIRSQVEGVENITISSELMTLINTRLSLYALLQDLVEERKNYQANNPNLPPEVVDELNRQDAELDNLPLADEADLLIQAMRTRQEHIMDAARQAAAENQPPPPGAGPQMRVATELAISQWMLIRDSNREALPAIYKMAYAQAAQEPLVKELMAAKIGHGRLVGGAVYLLGLHLLVSIANRERRRLAKAAKRLADEGLEEDGDSVLSLLGSLGKFASNLKNRGKIREEMAKLAEDDATNAMRAKMAGREIAFMEKTLEQEFKLLYRAVALRYIPESASMPWYVRAFLRYGVIGFSPWWMRAEVREFIAGDCLENVVLTFERGAADLQVLYADEYLYAVSLMEVTPSPDENLEQLDKNSVEWKTDRAYRRIVNARTYNQLMEEMLAQLDVTINYCITREQECEAKINEIKSRGFSGEGENVFDLQSEQQAYSARMMNLERQAERIKSEVVPSILEAIEDAEGRFRKGDLRIPDAETLISRETDALADLRRRMEGQKRIFPPLAVRDGFNLAADVINTRGKIRAELAELEGKDPGIFLNVIVPAKKKVNRVELRLSPTVIIIPAFGLECICSMAREGMEGGHLLLPSCFSRPGMRQHQLTNLLADFRWNTSRNQAGRDLASSDTLAGVFAKLRWAARTWPKAKRERALFYNEVKETVNWRRVYELISSESGIGCRQLYIRNQELYDGIIDRHIDLPEGVKKIVR